MVEIKLYERTGSYKGSNESVNISTEIFDGCDLFEKVVYEIKYNNTYETSWSWWYYKSYLHVYIHPKREGNPIFTYYVDVAKHIIQKLEVYYSRLHKNVPLIIGFVRKDITRYFTYLHLRRRNRHTGTPDEEFLQGALKARLVEENKKRNKVTFRVRDSSKNIKKDEEAYKNYRKHKYYASEDDPNGPYQFTMDNICSERNFYDIGGSGLSSVNNKSFDFINVIYTDQGNLPLLLEFVEHSTFNTSTKEYFKRISKNGTKWEKIENQTGELDKQRETNILQNLNYFVNKSIVIYINKNGYGEEYQVKLAENSDTIVLEHEALPININVNEQTQCLQDLKYKCYFHDLSKCRGHQVDRVTGLRLFITGEGNNPSSDIEIKLYDSDGLLQHYLYYNPSKNNVETIDKIFLYFNADDTVPLLLNYGTKWYTPKSKSKYFSKWLLVKDLESLETPKSSGSSTDDKILLNLQKTNKDLNEVILDNQANYGLNPTKTLKDFGSNRINATKNQVNKSYGTVVHRCVKYVIGKLIYNGKELAIDGAPLSLNDAYNRATLYYNLSDSEYKSPLMIGFTRVIDTNPDLYYERTKKAKDTKWKRIQHSVSQHFNQSSSLTNKINDIHYNFNKSIVIQLEKQSGPNYDLCLLESGRSSTGTSRRSDGSKITVSECPRSIVLKKYKCYQHTISLGKEIKPEIIGGLRLYLSTKEILIQSGNSGNNSPIYYHDSKKDLYVYFHKPDDNKVELTPLLVCYGNKYYGPTGSGQYFDKWKELTSVEEQQTQIQLDTINKELNAINISNTKHGSKYGINKPQAIEELKQEFYDRISVTVCKNKYYYMISHSSINKFLIGNVNYNGKQIISVDSHIISSQVRVFYDFNDNHFTKPLLICIGSQDLTDSSNKWYVRNNLQGSEWKTDHDRNKYDSSSKLQKELNIITSNLFIFLSVKIEMQDKYDTNITNKDKTHKTLITVDRLVSVSTLRAKNYRCFDHELHKCYEDKKNIISSIGVSTSDLTLDISLEISGKKIDLMDTSGVVLPILTYGNNDSVSRRSLYVYFYEPSTNFSSNSTDKVPMMLNYQNRFFGPEAKDMYFDQWKEINISSSDSDISDQIEAKLDRINSMLNEIDLSKNCDYGLFYCQKNSNSIGSSFKRIKVSVFKSNSHIMHVHGTMNKYKIGNIKTFNNQNLNDHINELSANDIDEVVAIFQKGNIQHAKLILINDGGVSFGSTTYGYYYDNTPRGSAMKYTYTKIQHGCYLIDPFNEGNEGLDFTFCSNIGDIKSLLIEITKERMNLQQSQQQSVIEDEDCKKQVDSESKINNCPIIGSTEQVGELRNALASSPGHSQVSIQANSDSRQGETQRDHTGQPVNLLVTPSESLGNSITTSETYHGSLPDQHQNNDVTPGKSPQKPESNEPSTPGSPDSRGLTSERGQQDQSSLGQKGVGSRSRDVSDVDSGTRKGENVNSEQDSMHEPQVTQISLPEEMQAISPGAKSELGSDQEHSRKGKDRDEEHSRHQGGSGGIFSPSRIPTEETQAGTRNISLSSVNRVRDTTVSSQDGNEIHEKPVGEKFADFIEENKGAVYGGGGTLATAAGGAYPLYKVIGRIMS